MPYRNPKFVAVALSVACLSISLLSSAVASASDDVLYVCHAQDTYVRQAPVGEIVGRIYHNQKFDRSEPTTPHGWIKGVAPAVNDGPVEQRHGVIPGFVDHDYVCTGPQT